MPRGGSRVGAGRPRKEKPGAVVLGMDGARLPESLATQFPATVSPAESVSLPVLEHGDLAVPPADIPESQQEVWRLYAPYAILQRTLIPETVLGFRQLCEQAAITKVIAARIEKVGAASKRAEVHLRHYAKMAQRLDSTLQRFKLTALGKAADPNSVVPKKTPANPWTQVG